MVFVAAARSGTEGAAASCCIWMRISRWSGGPHLINPFRLFGLFSLSFSRVGPPLRPRIGPSRAQRWVGRENVGGNRSPTRPMFLLGPSHRNTVPFSAQLVWTIRFLLTEIGVRLFFVGYLDKLFLDYMAMFDILLAPISLLMEVRDEVQPNNFNSI